MTTIRDRIRIDIDAGVADVRLARPEKMNALDPAMFAAIVEAGERLKNERGVRAVVLSGEGRAFCAGLDTGRFEGKLNVGSARERLLESPRTPGGANPLQQAALVWRELQAPVIGALHGVALGGGLQLALGCDIRLTRPDTRFALLEIRWGLVPDMGGFALARGLVRDDVFRELAWTGRMFTGEEAVALGFATRLSDDPRADALALAREIAERSPGSVRAIKRLAALSGRAGQAEILLAESQAQVEQTDTPNQREAVAAFLEKRPARFVD